MLRFCEILFFRDNRLSLIHLGDEWIENEELAPVDDEREYEDEGWLWCTKTGYFPETMIESYSLEYNHSMMDEYNFFIINA